jgi:acyl-CoA thioesterase-1
MEADLRAPWAPGAAGPDLNGMTSVAPALRYVALGDSYTIGTSVAIADRWPNQLVVALGGDAVGLELVANLAVNGYTSADLIRDELPGLQHLRPKFASLLIGVNDVVQGVPATTYGANLRTIFEVLLAGLPADRIVTVAIPDYTVTPRGADFADPGQQSQEIAAFNAIMERRSAERGVRYVDTFDLSRRAADDRSLVATDGLHPSGGQYRLWVGRIAPVVAGLLARQPDEVSDRRA